MPNILDAHLFCCLGRLAAGPQTGQSTANPTPQLRTQATHPITLHTSSPTSSAARGGQYSAAHAGPSSATSSWPLSQPSGLYSTASTRLPAHADSAASQASCSRMSTPDMPPGTAKAVWRGGVSGVSTWMGQTHGMWGEGSQLGILQQNEHAGCAVRYSKSSFVGLVAWSQFVSGKVRGASNKHE